MVTGAAISTTTPAPTATVTPTPTATPTATPVVTLAPGVTASPTPTATPVLPNGGLWNLLLQGNPLPVAGSPASYELYNLWNISPSNGVIDGYDYVKWLMMGGALQ